MNNRGPIIEPCGNPHVTSLIYDCSPFKKSY